MWDELTLFWNELTLLLNENSLEIHEVNDQYAPQELRKHHFDQRIREFTIAAATHFNLHHLCAP